MKKYLLTTWGALLTAAFFCGCTSVAKFEYSSAPGSMIRLQESGSGSKSIAVMPFMDQRGAGIPGVDGEISMPGDSGSFYWGFLPLFPFAGVKKEIPEASKDFVTLGRFHFDVSNDLADAAMQSLNASGLFKKVIKANDLKQANTDYIWRGKVHSTRYSGHYYQYCITYLAAPVLWILGAPMGDSVNELAVTFELIERTGGKVLWQYSYCNSDYVNHWIYRQSEDVTIYPRLMKQAMNMALRDLAGKLQ